MCALGAAMQRKAVLQDAELVKAEWTTDKQKNVCAWVILCKHVKIRVS